MYILPVFILRDLLWKNLIRSHSNYRTEVWWFLWELLYIWDVSSELRAELKSMTTGNHLLSFRARPWITRKLARKFNTLEWNGLATVATWLSKVRASLVTQTIEWNGRKKWKKNIRRSQYTAKCKRILAILFPCQRFYWSIKKGESNFCGILN